MKMELSALAKVLGGKKILRKNIQSRMDLVELSNKGVTKDALSHLAKYFSCSVNQMAQLLPVTERTIQRYTLERPFNRIVSEQILQIAEVAARGSEVFDGRDKFLAWMNHPNKALNNKTPMSLLSSKFGTDMVLDELGRIEHGVFS
ncbi:MAG: antitoxin Xre/MbcA/ParS toxin-binding domain-containing protein [bacterium]